MSRFRTWISRFLTSDDGPTAVELRSYACPDPDRLHRNRHDTRHEHQQQQWC